MVSSPKSMHFSCVRFLCSGVCKIGRRHFVHEDFQFGFEETLENVSLFGRIYLSLMCRIERGDRGSRSPLKKITKLYGFLAILVWIPWKITKLPSQHSMLGHHRHASETPFKWRFAGRPMMVQFLWYLDPLINWIIIKKTQGWTPLKKTFWIPAGVWRHRRIY